MSWEELAGWWLGEVSDPAYDEVVTPLLLDVLPRGGGGVVADLGSGDGRLMPVIAEATGGRVVGVELVEDLARESAQPVVLSRLPMLPLETGSLDGACVVLVLEHVEDHEAFFNETARAVKPGGFLVVVANHPFWTAPGSTPISDTDGEILWRPGRYFERGATVEPAGSGEVTFFHRSMSELTNAAAAAGWHLLRLVEKASHHVDMDSGVPRLAAFAWRRCDVP